MSRRAYFQVPDEYGDFHTFQTLIEAGEFAEQVLLSSGEGDIGIFEVKEVASVIREVSFNLHIYK